MLGSDMAFTRDSLLRLRNWRICSGQLIVAYSGWLDSSLFVMRMTDLSGVDRGSDSPPRRICSGSARNRCTSLFACILQEDSTIRGPHGVNPAYRVSQRCVRSLFHILRGLL